MPTFSAPPPHPATNEYSEADDQKIRMKENDSKEKRCLCCAGQNCCWVGLHKGGGIWTPDLSTSEILATENIKTSFTVAKEVVNEQQSSL